LLCSTNVKENGQKKTYIYLKTSKNIEYLVICFDGFKAKAKTFCRSWKTGFVKYGPAADEKQILSLFGFDFENYSIVGNMISPQEIQRYWKKSLFALLLQQKTHPLLYK
jgi:hypothetical protein